MDPDKEIGDKVTGGGLTRGFEVVSFLFFSYNVTLASCHHTFGIFAYVMPG